MSMEEEQQQGPQGVQGIQGVQGKLGKGEQGEKGDPGETGAAGKPGPGGRRVTWSFVAIVVISALVLSLFGCAVRENRQRIKEIRQANIEIEQANKEIVQAQKDIKQVQITDCQRNGKLLVSLIRPGLENLDQIDYYDTHPEEKALVRRKTNEALRLADPAHCAFLFPVKARKPVTPTRPATTTQPATD